MHLSVCMISLCSSDMDDIISTMSPGVTVSYKVKVSYRKQFADFKELGVGGLGPQVQQLYQRAFASRGRSKWISNVIYL